MNLESLTKSSVPGMLYAAIGPLQAGTALLPYQELGSHVIIDMVWHHYLHFKREVWWN